MGSDAAGTGSVTHPGGGTRSMPSTGDTRSLERASRPVPPVSAATSPEASASSSHPLYAALWGPSRSRSGATYERLNGLHAADTPAHRRPGCSQRRTRRLGQRHQRRRTSSGLEIHRQRRPMHHPRQERTRDRGCVCYLVKDRSASDPVTGSAVTRQPDHDVSTIRVGSTCTPTKASWPPSGGLIRHVMESSTARRETASTNPSAVISSSILLPARPSVMPSLARCGVQRCQARSILRLGQR